MNCKIVKSFVLCGQKIQPTTGLTWMIFYESWVFRFRCSTGTNKKRLTGGSTFCCWIFKTSLAFQLNDVSQFCRLFFCSQVCHPVQWCSVTLIQLFLCSQVWSKVLNSFAHLVKHRTTKLCSRLLHNVEWVWPSHKVCKRKTPRAWANKIRAQPGLSKRER